MSIVICRYGDFSIPDRNDLVGNALREYGEWAQMEIDVIAKFVATGDRVIDAGAFVGTHARAFSEMVGKEGMVYAFEPNPESYKYLCENAKLAPHSNISTYQIALGAQRAVGCLLADINKENLGAAKLSLDDVDSGGTALSIECLDDFALGKVDFIKADLEGMEYLMLLGGEMTISRHYPAIFLETNDLHSSSPVIAWANTRDYVVLGLIVDAFNPDNFNKRMNNMFGDARECSLLLIHRSKLVAMQATLSTLNLPVVETVDDLALLLLCKPQYFHDILKRTSFNALDLGNAIPQGAKAEIVDHSEQLAKLSQAVAEREGQITSLSQAMTEYEGQINSLSQAVAERDEKIVILTQDVAEHAIFIQRLITSNSWRITKLFRWFARLLRGDFEAAMKPVERIVSGQERRGIVDVQPVTEADFLKSSHTDFYLLQPSPIRAVNPVAVIIPIYRDAEMTKRCILAALAGIDSVRDARIIAINDASPDAGMQEMLEGLAAQWPNILFVLQNEINLGFVQTVNRGLAYLPEHDVVLLNSDVIVPEEWLQRLRNDAYSRADIGTVTPLSNNATICSFPHFITDNTAPFNLEVDVIDAAFRIDYLPCVTAPTGVGFCMYIKRACLKEVGYLDFERFGRGYGEENDFCQKILKKGWLNVISPNLYAHHEGGVSFSSEKAGLVNRAMQTIDKLHPNYHGDVQRFIRDDPLKYARIVRWLKLLSLLNKPKILHISHSLGGGVKQHIDELDRYFTYEAANLMLSPGRDENLIQVRLGITANADQIGFKIPEQYSELVDLCRGIGISAVHIHHTIGLNTRLLDLAADIDADYLVTVHDFYWLGANPTLTDKNGIYPGYYDEALQNPLYQLPKNLDIESFRLPLRKLLEGTSKVIFPSMSTKDIFDEVYKVNNFVIAPHIEFRCINAMLRNFVCKKKYVVGVLGALGREKGADLLEELASLARNNDLPFEFKLLGYAYRSLRNVVHTGPYRVDDLGDLIYLNRLDFVFFPARWPETYSYTLSYALESGLPIIAPNLGAFPERLSGRKNVLLFEHLSSPETVLSLIENFATDLASDMKVNAPCIAASGVSGDFYKNEYINIVAFSRPKANSVCLGRVIQNLEEHLYYVHDSTNKRFAAREKLLGVLWRTYTHPSLQWLARVIPYNIKRKVKRHLFQRPIHDIASINRGHK